MWLVASPRRPTIAAVVLGFLALLAGTAYSLTVHLTTAPQTVPYLLLAGATGSAVLSGNAALRAWEARQATRVAQLTGAGPDRPNWPACVAHAELAQLRAEVREAVSGRLAAIEQRIDDLDEEYERGWVAGATEASGGKRRGGHVRQLRPPQQPPQ